MVEPADRDGIFVVDPATERARRSEANVMRLARPATNNPGLRGVNLQCSLCRRWSGSRNEAVAIPMDYEYP